MENLFPKIDELLEGSTADVVTLSAAQLHWSSAAGVWSVAQCIEHVVMTLELYFEKMGPLLEQRERFQHPDTPYKAAIAAAANYSHFKSVMESASAAQLHFRRGGHSLSGRFSNQLIDFRWNRN